MDELPILLNIKQELTALHMSVTRAWKGDKAPTLVSQRLSRLERSLKYLDNEINRLVQQQWKDTPLGEEED